MKDGILRFLNKVNYWSIVIMPFSVAIAPGLANTFIGFFIASFFFIKLIKKERPFVNNKLLLPYLLFVIISLVSFKNSVDYSASFSGVVKLLKYAFIFLVCGESVADAKHLRRIVLSLVAGVALISIDGVWQIAFGRDFIRGNELQSAIGLTRATASFPNPNVMGVYLSAIAPLIAGLALFHYRGKKQAGMLLVAGIAATGIFLTLSRGTGLGFYLSVLFLSLLRKNKLVTFLLIALLVLFIFLMPKNIKDWAREVNYNPLVFMCNPDRISIYRNSINMINHHPFIGVGLNTFIKNYAKYKLPDAEAYAHTTDTIYAHNNFLQMAGETGLLGLGAFFWMLFVFFKQGIRAYKKIDDPFLKIVSLSLLACVISYLVNGLTETSLYYARVSMVFWYIIGISLSLNKFAYGNKAP